MTSANVFNLNSVKQGQVLNANAAKGRSKAENPDAAGVFASLMGSNYSTNFNMPSVNTKINNNVLQQTNAADNYDRYQYQDNTIRQVAGDVVTDVIGNSTDTLDQFQGDVVRTVAEQLGVSEDSVKDMMESLGLTAFDLLNPENLAQLAMQLTGETSPMDLLMNDQFQRLMQQLDKLGGQLANELNLQPAQMDELIAQMDILQTPETLTDEEMQILTDAAGQQTTADTVSTDIMPELAQTDEVQPMDKQADVFQKEPKSDEVRTQQPQAQDTKQTTEQQTDTGDADADAQTGDQMKSAQPEKMTADRSSSDQAKTQTVVQMQDTAGVPTAETVADITPETSYVSIDTMDLLEQVAEQIRVNVSEGTSSMEMQLNPENLGKVYVNISSKEGVIHAQLAASNEAVRAALETQVADLRQNLNQAGVKVDAVEVTVASHEFEKNLEQNQESEKQQGERQQEQSGGRRRNLNLSSLDELSGLMTEEETLAAQMMRENGNSMDVTAEKGEKMADTTTSALNWASVENGKVKTTTSKKSDESNNGTMGYDQFLTLLCAEMQYQDPLEPTSNTEYVAQLATFSQLEAMLGMQDTQKNEMANNLVGKYVILKVSDETTGKTSYVDGKVDYVMYQEDGSQMLSVNNKLYSIDTLDTVADSDYYEAIGYAKTISNMLAQLPDIENITTKYSGAIEQIRKVYDGMTDYQKSFVSESDLAKLKKYEQKIKDLGGDTSDDTKTDDTKTDTDTKTDDTKTDTDTKTDDTKTDDSKTENGSDQKSDETTGA